MGCRKALVVGINEYNKLENMNLKQCVNDSVRVGRLLSRNYDDESNFDVKYLNDSTANCRDLLTGLKQLFFSQDIDIALFYFSGHGFQSDSEGFIVCSDTCQENGEIKNVISFKDIVNLANQSTCRTKIIILDCCFSGLLGSQATNIGDITQIGRNTVILTACADYETASESSEGGVFTNLLVGGLDGGAGDILGNITPASLYAYIDKALNSWQQRPFFKANVSSFIPIRKCKPAVEISDLSCAMSLFENKNQRFFLDPSFEFTNYEGSPHNHKPPYAIEENVKKFKLLQKMNQNGLVTPVDEEYMYYAAMNSKSCELTPLGKHFWSLYKENKLR